MILRQQYLQLSSQAVGVSSVTGDGFDGFLAAVEASRKEYEKYATTLVPPAGALTSVYSEYVPELERVREKREKTLQKAKDENMTRVLKDLAIDREKNPVGTLADRWDPDEDDDDGDINIIDRCERP